METISGTQEELYIQAAAMIAERIAAVLAEKGVCIIGMMGGRSVHGIMERLVAYGGELRGPIHVFWIDERCEGEKNFVVALPHFEQMLKEGVNLHWYPIQSVHRQQLDVEIRQITVKLHALGGKIDIVIASAGEDGHVASIFPRHHLLQAMHSGYGIEEHAPKPPALRVSMTPPVLVSAKHALLFFVHKHEAFAQFTDPQVPVADCPAKLLLQVEDLTAFVSREPRL